MATVISPLQTWRNWGSERNNNLSKGTQRFHGKGGTWTIILSIVPGRCLKNVKSPLLKMWTQCTSNLMKVSWVSFRDCGWRARIWYIPGSGPIVAEGPASRVSWTCSMPPWVVVLGTQAGYEWPCSWLEVRPLSPGGLGWYGSTGGWEATVNIMVRILGFWILPQQPWATLLWASVSHESSSCQRPVSSFVNGSICGLWKGWRSGCAWRA